VWAADTFLVGCHHDVVVASYTGAGAQLVLAIRFRFQYPTTTPLRRSYDQERACEHFSLTPDGAFQSSAYANVPAVLLCEFYERQQSPYWTPY
jgi:hypothetical protein